MQAITPLVALGMLPTLKRELPQFVSAAANAPVFDKSDVKTYSAKILEWYGLNGNSFPAWALSARIVFASRLIQLRVSESSRS